MRKTIAAISASVLGLAGAVAAAAAPANAVEPKCAQESDVTVSANANVQDLYVDCIPQFGLGKAEFTISTSAGDPFPSGYNLHDGHQTITSNVDSAVANSYFDVAPSEVVGGWEDLQVPSSTTPTQQNYTDAATYAVFPITSFTSIDPASLPAACTPDAESYAHAYEITYGTSTTTFKENIDGKVWTVTTTETAAPLYLGLNFAAGGGSFDTTKAQCSSSAIDTLVAENSGDANWAKVTGDEATFSTTSFGPFVDSDTFSPEGAGGTEDFGNFAATSVPVLATTGYDAAPVETLGGGLLIGGLALIALRFSTSARRRRTRHKTP
ncbi:MAG TPA: hypothetical protein VHX87_11270 [Galbitalea sp.]|nr:hypothetical protein [Galbitalea sp.]